MAATIHVFPTQWHRELEAIARRIVAKYPYEKRWAAISAENMKLYKRQCRRFPSNIAFEQWKDMGAGLAYHVGVIERQVDAA